LLKKEIKNILLGDSILNEEYFEDYINTETKPMLKKALDLLPKEQWIMALLGFL
jgi:hypothetical protein